MQSNLKKRVMFANLPDSPPTTSPSEQATEQASSSAAQSLPRAFDIEHEAGLIHDYQSFEEKMRSCPPEQKDALLQFIGVSRIASYASDALSYSRIMRHLPAELKVSVTNYLGLSRLASFVENSDACCVVLSYCPGEMGISLIDIIGIPLLVSYINSPVALRNVLAYCPAERKTAMIVAIGVDPISDYVTDANSFGSVMYNLSAELKTSIINTIGVHRIGGYIRNGQSLTTVMHNCPPGYHPSIIAAINVFELTDHQLQSIREKCSRLQEECLTSTIEAAAAWNSFTTPCMSYWPRVVRVLERHLKSNKPSSSFFSLSSPGINLKITTLISDIKTGRMYDCEDLTAQLNAILEEKIEIEGKEVAFPSALPQYILYIKAQLLKLAPKKRLADQAAAASCSHG